MAGRWSTPWNRKNRYNALSIPPAGNSTVSSINRPAETDQITHKFPRRGLILNQGVTSTARPSTGSSDGLPDSRPLGNNQVPVPEIRMRSPNATAATQAGIR
jgi:hypothetical protein